MLPFFHFHAIIILYFKPKYFLLLSILSVGLFLSPCLGLGVPAVMVCAVGAAGMAITIHGSLAEACTQRTHMREGERQGRSDEEVKKVTKRKKGGRIWSEGWQTEWILFHAVIIMKLFRRGCDDGGFLSSSYVKPLDGSDTYIITQTTHRGIFLAVTESGWRHFQTCLKPTELWVLK